jgi:RHS repeat-associated protein
LFGQATIAGEIFSDPDQRTAGYINGNGIRTDYKYNREGRLDSINMQGLRRLEYSYDENGKISGITSQSGQQRYAYDAAGRLSQAITELGAFQYQHDAVGNIVQSSHRVAPGQLDVNANTFLKNGEGNRLVASQGKATSHNQFNNAGSLLSDGSIAYQYNSEQRPLKVLQGGELLAEYSYNAFGERIKKVVYRPGSRQKLKVTYYFYDGQQLAGEVDAASGEQVNYVYLASKPIAKLERDEIYALHTNHLGLPLAATDSEQRVVWSADYTPFGLASIRTAKIELNLRFPGQYADAERGIHYNYLRDYDPHSGRYLTSDPIGLRGGVNRYAYVGGDPVNLTDPLGLEWEAADGSFPQWATRLIIGQEVHSMFTDYVRSFHGGVSGGYGGGDTLNHTFGSRMPDAYNYLSSEVWELKPMSYQTDTVKYTMTQKTQVQDYINLANTSGSGPTTRGMATIGGWQRGGNTTLLEGKTSMDLGYVQIGMGPFAEIYKITLHADDNSKVPMCAAAMGGNGPTAGATGMIFYDYELVEDHAGKLGQQILETLAKIGWSFWPGLGPRGQDGPGGIPVYQ